MYVLQFQISESHNLQFKNVFNVSISTNKFNSTFIEQLCTQHRELGNIIKVLIEIYFININCPLLLQH